MTVNSESIKNIENIAEIYFTPFHIEIFTFAEFFVEYRNFDWCKSSVEYICESLKEHSSKKQNKFENN